MVEVKKITKNYPVSAHSMILETTPLYTSILTEELNRLYHQLDSLKKENLALKSILKNQVSDSVSEII